MSTLNIVTVNATTRHLADVAVRRRARDLTSTEMKQEWFRDLVRDLFETLYATPGGIGLAATQTGVLLRVAVISLRDGSKPLVLVNPSYVPASEETDLADERCLSVPDVAGAIARFREIAVHFADQQGRVHDTRVSDFLARVMQHEIDHLDGVLYLDRITDPSLIRSESGGFPARHAQTALERLYAAGASE